MCVEADFEFFPDQPGAEKPLVFRCPFLGCEAYRVWEGGQRPLMSSQLATCHRCGYLVQTDPTERSALLRRSIELGL